MNTIITKEAGFVLDKNTENLLCTYEHEMKELKEKQDALKKQIKEEMEAKGIIKIDTEAVLINYVEGYEKEAFNSKKFKEEYPDLYDEFIEFKKTASSVRFKIK